MTPRMVPQVSLTARPPGSAPKGQGRAQRQPRASRETDELQEMPPIDLDALRPGDTVDGVVVGP